MDNAVALVQAYLRVNGYFTVSEFPVLEAGAPAGSRTRTDLDILAFRFPGATAETGERAFPDPALGAGGGEPDMIVGEVKEGRARVNDAARDPFVVRAALVRFGCCTPETADAVAREMIRTGSAPLPNGHRVRLVAFGSRADGEAHPYHTVTLGQVVRYLQDYLRAEWEQLRHTEWKDPALGFLVTLEKALLASEPRSAAAADLVQPDHRPGRE